MSNQQSMFAEPEHQPSEQWIENMDPREQQRQELREEYPVYGEEAYYAQRGGAKIQPGQRQRPRRRFGIPLVVGLLILGLLLLGGGMRASHEAPRWGDNEHHHPMMQQAFQQQIPVSSGEKVVVQIGYGNVNLHAGAEGVVQLNSSDGGHINYSQSGDSLIIALGGNGDFPSNAPEVDVTLPQNSDVQVQDHSGSVALNDLNGSIQVNTSGGDIRGSNLQGKITLQANSGDIHVEGINGQAHFSTSGGDIEVSQGNLTGDSTFSSDGGNITYDGALASGNSDHFTTSDGDVSISLPADASVSVKTQTGSGNVTNDFGATPSTPSPANVSVTTSSGDITIDHNS